LLIAPRHPERAKDVEKLLIKHGFLPVYISKLSPAPGSRLRTPDPLLSTSIYILDTIGQLVSFYNIADIVFVGGSLIKKGGHNILEPAALGKPVLCGPYMFNFRDIADLFIRHNAALMVRTQEELTEHILSLLASQGRVSELSNAAKRLI
jgi:3-deoxy-D-manno-octulosonic-acid transferase